jgi:penicillin-binding protein 1C
VGPGSLIALRRRLARVLLILLGGALLGSLALVLVPVPQPPFPPDYSTVITAAGGGLLRVYLNQREQWHLPPRPELEIPPALETCVLHFEDRRFYRHPGIDALAIVRAAWQDLRAGRAVSGASTITMQVARLVRPKPRTLLAKIGEALQAVRLEMRYSKRELLHLYLDHAPYGGNIVGVQTAAWRYFGHPPEQLTWSQAATLAVLPNAPGLVSPQADPLRLRQRRNALLQELYDSGAIDSLTAALAQREDVPRGLIRFPLYAPHLSRQLALSRRNWVHTTIDRQLQRRAADLVSRHSIGLSQTGIHHAAALIAETSSGYVRAYVGSPDFFDAAAGQVDGVGAPRSSGSLLKPLLYALAMDQGLILPPTLVHDVPTFYGAFAPRNADREYRGLVPAATALTQSLNVPAVRLLNAYGLQAFHGVLRAAGLSTIFRSADEYGLPLIIGGAEVTLWDMAALYRGLGRHGVFAPLQILADTEPPPSGVRLVSAGAAQLALDMLREVARPGAEFYWRQYQHQRPLAWKTGTSYGHRDAWAVGVSPAWTVAVWAGNFSGEGSSELSGASSAGPLLFDLFNALPDAADGSWFGAPGEALGTVQLCADTGYTAGPDCPVRMATPAPRHMKPMALCPYHQTVHLSASGHEQVCSLCWAETGHQSVSRLLYPPDIAELLRSRGQSVAALPPHRRQCPSQQDDDPLEIVYPQPGAHIWLPRDLDGTWQEVVLKAAHRVPDEIVYWYVDDRFLGSTRDQHARAVALDPGWHRLHVVDCSGQSVDARFHLGRRE